MHAVFPFPPLLRASVSGLLLPALPVTQGPVGARPRRARARRLSPRPVPCTFTALGQQDRVEMRLHGAAASGSQDEHASIGWITMSPMCAVPALSGARHRRSHAAPASVRRWTCAAGASGILDRLRRCARPTSFYLHPRAHAAAHPAGKHSNSNRPSNIRHAPHRGCVQPGAHARARAPTWTRRAAVRSQATSTMVLHVHVHVHLPIKEYF